MFTRAYHPMFSDIQTFAPTPSKISRHAKPSPGDFLVFLVQHKWNFFFGFRSSKKFCWINDDDDNDDDDDDDYDDTNNNDNGIL